MKGGHCPPLCTCDEGVAFKAEWEDAESSDQSRMRCNNQSVGRMRVCALLV